MTADANTGPEDPRALYAERMQGMQQAFEATADGVAACLARSAAVDEVIRSVWQHHRAAHPAAADDLCIAAVGGFGRRHLFPCSDVDLLFCTGRNSATDALKNIIRQISQSLWDCGLKLAPATRSLAECERFQAANPEFGLALLDLRFVTGSQQTFDALQNKIHDRRSAREASALGAAAAELTRERHARFGHTLFHLEPNVKDAPGGLRDANVCGWLRQLASAPSDDHDAARFHEAVAFLTATRVFLHLRHGRDDNTLDWHAQDEAAAASIGFRSRSSETTPAPDAATWMRAYFRHARAVQHQLARELERNGHQPRRSRSVLRVKAPEAAGFYLKDGVLDLSPAKPGLDNAQEADVVLAAFGLVAETGVTLAPATEERIAAAIPMLSSTLEEGPRLWLRLRSILNGANAGNALRAMHALGVLELILPEFHGIDALVIRDAYHRYTVDEHTFVLIDFLHGLAADLPANAPEWRMRFRAILLELPNPELLYLAALLHDTGKGRVGHGSLRLERASRKRRLRPPRSGQL